MSDANCHRWRVLDSMDECECADCGLYYSGDRYGLPRGPCPARIAANAAAPSERPEPTPAAAEGDAK